MAMIINGAVVTTAMNERIKEVSDKLRAKGIASTLAILRIGERPEDLSYERGALKRMAVCGIEVKQVILPEDVTQVVLMNEIYKLNEDKGAHGVLMFRPLPKHLDEKAATAALDPAKDMDGITEGSMAGLYSGSGKGYPPCTAVTVIVCHTKTVDMPSVCRNAEIIVAAVGKARAIGADYVSEGQIIIDVGINVDEKGKLCGNVDFDAVEPIVSAITPVPGGVGGVTTSVLVSHVVQAAGGKL